MSSDNIFADLGLSDVEELLFKAQFVSEFRDVVKRHKLTQSRAAALTSTAQPDLSNLFRGRFNEFSVEWLMLTGLERDVEITLGPARSHGRREGSSSRERRLAAQC
jgi:predicted XRE-type DNA-binding protein